MDVRIEKSWKAALDAEFDNAYFGRLTEYVRQEYRQHTCFPPAGQIFRAFDLCPFDRTKVVIIGQDPYHGDGQANGLSFSVGKDIPLPPSLINIFKEVSADVGTSMPKDGDLSRWAAQGVLMLNAILTVRAHEPGSHRQKGWEAFTDAAIDALSREREHIVFMLWGSFARGKSSLIDSSKHLILHSAHPSPLSANRGGWFGNRHFSKANQYLTQHQISPINW